MTISRSRTLPTLVLTLLGLGAATVAQAETRVPGTKVFYSYQKDPMNDANLSIVFIDELNDTGSNTYLSMKCAAGQGWLFGIATKHALLPTTPIESRDELDKQIDDLYAVSYRVGTSQAATVGDIDSAWLNRKLRPESLLFYDMNANNAIAQGLMDGKKVVIRIQPRRDGAVVKQQLDYTFQPQGFAQAFAAVKYCK
ncbi:hypothetical protein E5F05_07255 [Deinococcus metallilatus]|uniref:Uncharacterized protein n=1 Tax=Deinococcus metallilatus TaxID=1211322 RepID=A0AAJ5JXF7_9DEIO|nr:hypothetical protein [Deinococcus metallilatus]MBB5297073.1 hypothetical protein [Deinococcus metallilatus]QBY07767.1 hypothetical protein E5F05_07255 [Deinococcus metallilatus]RXJ13467.1 hypothetical protein ERJ73_06090 [Deinococcus metallilatus]TLK22376.1 hypothetical protein FCS05_17910 [Deinococcus metallilatus]GMA17325.1 hypothetical protein GCM10025871_36560 [Deinococcus metallilatus]